MLRIRTGCSFKTAIGTLPEVLDRLTAINAIAAPITDRTSTFGFVKWTKLCKTAGIKPVYGVELAVVDDLYAKRPAMDFWTFIAIDSLKPLHNLIAIATDRQMPALSYETAATAEGLVKVAGERCLLNLLPEVLDDDFYLALSPESPKGLINEAINKGIPLIATSANFYANEADKEFYRVALDWRANNQSCPMHVLDAFEWAKCFPCLDAKVKADAMSNAEKVLKQSNAQLPTATLVKPEKKQTLLEMCKEGALRTGTNLNDFVYAGRLMRELEVIETKGFDDYFYILADIVNWAKERMVVGPARGSSCGSLVSYLLNITTIDPIPYGLIFERFIDLNRTDLPDIDVDFSDERRHLLFEYAAKKYGADRVARLGTVGLFKARSAMIRVCKSLHISKLEYSPTLDGVIQRSSGDARAMQTLVDTLKESDAGQSLLARHPHVIMAGRLEGHPNNASQHAAGILITQQPIINYVAIDQRAGAGEGSGIGAAMCDKKDAEILGLLKIDALGLTQLSVFEGVLRRIGKPDISGQLESIPLDDPKAFEILNNKLFAGIFQFTGPALQNITKEIKVDSFNDMIVLTAMARPGPLATGGTADWVQRRNNPNLQYKSIHPMLDELTAETLGVIVYQEQVMRIVRDIGQFTWEDTSAIRKAMSGSLGDEYFARYSERFYEGARRNGLNEEQMKEIWEHINTMGCLSGDTVLINPYVNSKRTKTITLKELYDQKGLLPGTNAKAKGKMQPLYCLVGDTIKPVPLIEVSCSGERETWLIEVDTGETIRATMEHRFLCADMIYRPLKELKSGQAVLMMGSTNPTKRKAKKGTGSGGHNWWQKKKDGEPLFKQQLEKLHRIYTRCQNCKKKPYQETHHIDGDHENHAWENLLPVCRSCHRQLHGISAPHSKGKSPRLAHIVSITEPMIETTYDIAMPKPNNNFIANSFILHNSWTFNKAHAVAYATVSYWCMWLKAYYPLEFAAATLDQEHDAGKIISMLRELKAEGIGYKPVDADLSANRWEVDKENKMLLGPLWLVKGIGPAAVLEILEARRKDVPVRESIRRKLVNAVTEIDSLWPILDAIKNMDEYKNINIVTKQANICDLDKGMPGEHLIAGCAVKISTRDQNEAVQVQKRGYEVKGPHWRPRLTMQDDRGIMICRIGRRDYEKFAPRENQGWQANRVCYLLKGIMMEDVNLFLVRNIKFCGFLPKKTGDRPLRGGEGDDDNKKQPWRKPE